MTTPPDNIRLTVTVSPEVHAAFQRMSEVSGMPIGRCMGEWMRDTLEGVEFVTHQLQRAREAPRQVVREMLEEAAKMEKHHLQSPRNREAIKLAAMGIGAPPATRSAAAAAPPRPVIRGGKSPSGKAKDHR